MFVSSILDICLFFFFLKITKITKSLRLNKCKRNRKAEIERGDVDTEKESEKGRGDEMRHGERNKERGRVPKAVHCALQSKGKESKVHLNHTPSAPLPDLNHQIAGIDINNGTFFSQFCRFGYKTLLLIEFFCWVGLDLIRFCFGFLESLSKWLFSQF